MKMLFSFCYFEYKLFKSILCIYIYIKNKLEKKECTYKPGIIKTEMPNDEKFIERNLNQIQEYVNRRRAFIQKSKEKQRYIEQKLNLDVNLRRFVKKPTIPKEFCLTKTAAGAKANNNNNDSSDAVLKIKKIRNTELAKGAFCDATDNFNSNYSQDARLDSYDNAAGKSFKAKSPNQKENNNNKVNSVEKFRKQFKTQQFFENREKNICNIKNNNNNKAILGNNIDNNYSLNEYASNYNNL